MEKDVAEPEFRFGEGKISGVLSVVLAALALGAVLCLLFPSALTTPEVREVLPMNLVRWIIQFTLASAFVLGVLSVVLSKRKTFGIVGVMLSVIGTLLGGSKSLSLRASLTGSVTHFSMKRPP